MSEIFIVPESATRGRADKVLAAAFPEHSRTAWQRALDQGLVTRAGVALARKHDVGAGDELVYAMPVVTPSEVRAVAIPLDVLFEDEHLLVVNKAAGMVVHPGAGTEENTLVHALLAHCAGGLSGIGGVERPGIVHRLDRETSGAIVVAKHDAAHRGLSEQFAGRQLHKEYLALAAEVPRLLSGSINAAILRDPKHRHRMTVGEGGKPARTDWKLEEAFPQHHTALIRCHILTGRTHQIRVHLKSIGHPLLGDRTYGWRVDDRLPTMPSRVMLHAAYLKFLHPVTGQSVEINTPLPDDFLAMLTALRGKTSP